MKIHTRALAIVATLTALLGSASGCKQESTESAEDSRSSSSGAVTTASRPLLAEGTPLSVRLTSTLSSEHAHAGDSWTGTLVHPVIVGERVVLPEGSPVRGVVTSAVEAKRGDRAQLAIAVRSINANGKEQRVNANSEPVIAGSPRARNLGAIAGGAAAGALLGKAIGGDGKDAAVGGLIGGAAATGAVAKSKGYQVVLKPGIVMTFTVNESVAMR